MDKRISETTPLLVGDSNIGFIIPNESNKEKVVTKRKEIKVKQEAIESKHLVEDKYHANMIWTSRKIEQNVIGHENNEDDKKKQTTNYKSHAAKEANNILTRQNSVKGTGKYTERGSNSMTSKYMEKVSNSMTSKYMEKGSNSMTSKELKDCSNLCNRVNKRTKSSIKYNVLKSLEDYSKRELLFLLVKHLVKVILKNSPIIISVCLIGFGLSKLPYTNNCTEYLKDMDCKYYNELMLFVVNWIMELVSTWLKFSVIMLPFLLSVNFFSRKA